MVRKVKITDAITGEELREDYVRNQPLIFGFLSPSDVLKFGSAVIMVIVFFVNGQNDKKMMQDNLSELKITTSRLVDFKENSDGFNSQVYNTRFRNGEPIDQNFKIPNRGSMRSGI